MGPILSQRAPHQRILLIEIELVVRNHIVAEVAFDSRQRVVAADGEAVRVAFGQRELQAVVDRLAVLTLLIHLADAVGGKEPARVGAGCRRA